MTTKMDIFVHPDAIRHMRIITKKVLNHVSELYFDISQLPFITRGAIGAIIMIGA